MRLDATLRRQLMAQCWHVQPNHQHVSNYLLFRDLQRTAVINSFILGTRGRLRDMELPHRLISLLGICPG